MNDTFILKIIPGDPYYNGKLDSGNNPEAVIEFWRSGKLIKRTFYNHMQETSIEFPDVSGAEYRRIKAIKKAK